ncbi:MAG: hypothetical protein GF349_03985 [Candidatus Magasanikbacteria bacterium]|nr:hypothetical protein [Candidatus Magasanikbacteria bacterium]
MQVLLGDWAQIMSRISDLVEEGHRGIVREILQNNVDLDIEMSDNKLSPNEEGTWVAERVSRCNCLYLEKLKEQLIHAVGSDGLEKIVNGRARFRIVGNISVDSVAG